MAANASTPGARAEARNVKGSEALPSIRHAWHVCRLLCGASGREPTRAETILVSFTAYSGIKYHNYPGDPDNSVTRLRFSWGR